ncbi:MAG TPA: GTP pyrophosphokinase [Porphyromonadaceae bacterium]|nr:GTP pyrophosphokinase [Porphyromonadaceae bacterium]
MENEIDKPVSDVRFTEGGEGFLSSKKLDDYLIEEEFQSLLNDYLNTPHRKNIEIITKAFHFASNAHKGIRRRSGEPYILHPIAVARIVAKEIGLGSTSICAALLHDVVEDTDYTVEDISNLFNPKIAQLVDGLTKISGGIFGENASQQAENFRKLLLTMSDDIRVILIKMADRLHNMRTLDSMPREKQFKIAGETLYIYAPLAHRLGLNRVKMELEDLAFKREHPDDYKQIEQKIRATDTLRQKYYEDFMMPIHKELQKTGISYETKKRIKSIYSIWNKIQTKNVAFENIYDIMAVRIVFSVQEGQDEAILCWKIYTIITQIYKLHPDRIRDWVSSPKANGYKALHVTVMGPGGQWVEVQIRSHEMDEIAERGLAAHWSYKEGDISTDTELNNWIATVKEILENPDPNALDFLETVKMNLFSNEIFVCTPKGEFKTLPQGSTALDFAFSLHSDVGYNCLGAKVNHKLVPLSYKLNSGDQVEVIVSKSQQPKPEWKSFVTTACAKNKLNFYFKRQRRISTNKGEDLLKKFIQENELELESSVTKLISLTNSSNREELFFRIGVEEIVLDKALLGRLKNKNSNRWKRLLHNPFSTNTEIKENQEQVHIDKKEVFVLNEEDMHKTYRFCTMCHPIPGDEVIGFVDEKGKVVVHWRSCPVAISLKSGFGNQIVRAEWGNFSEKLFDICIELMGTDSDNFSKLLLKSLDSLSHIKLTAIHLDTKNGIIKGELMFKVRNGRDIQQICKSLKEIEGMEKVSRKSSYIGS